MTLHTSLPEMFTHLAHLAALCSIPQLQVLWLPKNPAKQLEGLLIGCGTFRHVLDQNPDRESVRVCIFKGYLDRKKGQCRESEVSLY